VSCQPRERLSSGSRAGASRRAFGASMRRVLVLFALVVLPGAAQADLREEFAAALLRWSNAHIGDYAYDYRNTRPGMFPLPCTALRTIVARRGSARFIALDGARSCRKGSVLSLRQYKDRPRSIQALFDLVDQFIPLEGECRTVVVKYDERFGYPTFFESIDSCATHGDWGFEVTNFARRR
jgi:hypothetical protein